MPYIPRLIHALNETDPERRLQFCTGFLYKCDERKYFQYSIVWAGEVTFKLSSTINRHSCVYWAYENPHIVQEKAVNAPGVKV
jgi:hypothetical protein